MSYPPYNDPAMQGQGYAPPQVGYPPQQGYPQQGYPSQAPGYPPQGYPQQQPTYPAQGYPPQGYPPQEHISNVKDGPPAYTDINPAAALPPMVQQQTSSNVVVVQQQPTPVVYATSVNPVSDNFLILSIVLTVCCFIWGTWYGLLCTIPALIFAIMAQDAQRRGDNETAKTHSRISLGLNVTAIVCWVVILLIIIISISVSIANASSSSDSYCYYRYNSYYEYYYYTCDYY